jgi:hypothetical protein
MKTVTQQFIGTTQKWETTNPRLYKGVWAFELTNSGTIRIKIGQASGEPGSNGDTLAKRWNDLSYLNTDNIMEPGGNGTTNLTQLLESHGGNVGQLQAALQALSSALNSEIQARTAAVNSEIQARQAAVNAEAQARAGADSGETYARMDGDRNEAEARAAGDTREAEERTAAIEEEALARYGGDQTLRTEIAVVSTATDSVRFAFEYLLQYLTAKFGPMDAINIALEGGDYLGTEDGTLLVA